MYRVPKRFSGALLLLVLFGNDQLLARDIHSLQPRLNGGSTTSEASDRFALIGMISESTSGKKAVAVIRDKKQSKTFTIRAGDSIPGSSEIRLERVERNFAILVSGNDKIQITHDLSEPASAVAERNIDSNKRDLQPASPSTKSEDLGLFDRWYSERGAKMLDRKSTLKGEALNKEVAADPLFGRYQEKKEDRSDEPEMELLEDELDETEELEMMILQP